MKSNTNIYDIDGNILRKAGDTEELSITEAQNRVKDYQEKIKELSENEGDKHKISVYQTYIDNLQRYIMNYYINHPELMNSLHNTTQDEIQKAMKELKAEVEAEESMDEYVEPIEEIKDANE